MIDLDALRDTTADYIRSSKATNTRRAYRADWDHFTAWCTAHSFVALPAEPATVAMYAAALAEEHKVATITRRLAAISQAHQAAGYESPCKVSIVRAAMAGIRRSKGTAPATKTPTLTDDIRMMVAATPDTLLGTTRSRAAARGLCRGIPSIGACRHRSRRCGDYARGACGNATALEDGSRWAWAQGCDTVRLASTDMPCTGAGGMAAGVWH